MLADRAVFGGFFLRKLNNCFAKPVCHSERLAITIWKTEQSLADSLHKLHSCFKLGGAKGWQTALRRAVFGGFYETSLSQRKVGWMTIQREQSLADSFCSSSTAVLGNTFVVGMVGRRSSGELSLVDDFCATSTGILRNM